MAYISFNGTPTAVTNPWTISGSVSLGDVVYQVAGADRTVARAKADDAAKVPPLGVVTGISGSTAQVAGNGEMATGFSGLSPGTVYWLDTVAGQVTSTKPAANIYLIGVAVSETSMLVGFTAAALSSGGGGGSGTVTSVSFDSNDGSLLVGGGTTITGSGTVSVNLATVPVARGGTGQTDKTIAFTALAPTLAKGDLIQAWVTPSGGFPGSRVAVGTDGQALSTITSSTGYGNFYTPWWTTAPSGSISSVNVTNTDGYLNITGGPVTSSGTLSVSLNGTVPVAKGGTGLTAMAEEGALLYANAAGGYTSQNVFPYMRNRLINGNMIIHQRGGASYTTNGSFPVDRWKISENTLGTFTAAQTTTAPPGFTHSIQFTTTGAGTAAGSEYLMFSQNVEGTTIADLEWGTADAKTITVSFWVRASLTGTYSVAIRNSAYGWSYVTPYTITEANTWEYKSVVITGPTTGTWLSDTGAGLRLLFDMGSGPNLQTNSTNQWLNAGKQCTPDQVNVIGTVGATFNLTGVQLEVGTVATPYEWRHIQTELALCQRYFGKMKSLGGSPGFGAGVYVTVQGGTPTASIYVPYPRTMRAYPTIGYSTLSGFTATRRTITIGASLFTLDSCTISMTVSVASLSGDGRGILLVANNSAASYIDFNAEIA